MKLPSFSIAEMMAIVAIVALDCLVLRVAIDIGIPYLILSGSPMQIALVIGLLLIFRRRRQTEKPFSFLIGFEVVGWMGHVIYVVLCLQAVGEMGRHIGATPWPLLRAIGLSPFYGHNMNCTLLCYYVLCDRPPIGGSVVCRLAYAAVVEAYPSLDSADP